MKRVSFNVAKAIKEAGYPQDCCNEYWIKFKNKPEPLIINGDEALDFYENISDETDENYVEEYYAVTEYLEVWLWLWRKKKIKVSLDLSCRTLTSINADYWIGDIDNILKDPEEAIIAAIEYIINENLLK